MRRIDRRAAASVMPGVFGEPGRTLARDEGQATVVGIDARLLL
jgi:hypothetical protein